MASTLRSLTADYLEGGRAAGGDARGLMSAYAAGLTPGLVPAHRSLLPYLLDTEQYRTLEEVASVMGAIMEKVMAKYQRDRSFRALFGFPREIEELTLVPSGCRAAVPLARLDLAFDRETGDYTICSIATGGVSGMVASVEAMRVMQQTPGWRSFAQDHTIVPTPDAARECVMALLNTYGKWANAQEGRNHPTNPSLAVVDLADSPRADESAYLIDRLREEGCYAHLTDPSELRIETVGGIEQLVDADGPVTCVWLRLFADELLAHRGAGTRALIEATRRGLVCTIGGYRSWPCCTRSFLSVLRSKECRALLTRHENAFVDAHVSDIDVLSTASDISRYYDQEGWVLRTVDAPAREGLLAGAGMAKAAWRNRLVKGIKRRDAVQPLIEVPTCEVLPEHSVANDDATELPALVGLYVFEGKLGGVRVSCGDGLTASDWDPSYEIGCVVVDV